MVKASASRGADPGSISVLVVGVFSGSSHTGDFRIGTLVAIPWHSSGYILAL